MPPILDDVAVPPDNATTTSRPASTSRTGPAPVGGDQALHRCPSGIPRRRDLPPSKAARPPTTRPVAKRCATAAVKAHRDHDIGMSPFVFDAVRQSLTVNVARDTSAPFDP